MSTDVFTDARALVHRVYDALNSGHLEDFDRLFTADFVDHGDGSTGVEPLRERMAAFRAAFPDLHVTVDQVLVDGIFVASRTTTSGTHREPLMGMPATGQRVQVPAVDIVRIGTDGRAAERWGGLDTYALLVQLGVVSPGG
jgi:steroid delta-isomerase-like uncharacterized protein